MLAKVSGNLLRVIEGNPVGKAGAGADDRPPNTLSRPCQTILSGTPDPTVFLFSRRSFGQPACGFQDEV